MEESNPIPETAGDVLPVATSPQVKKYTAVNKKGEVMEIDEDLYLKGVSDKQRTSWQLFRNSKASRTNKPKWSDMPRCTYIYPEGHKYYATRCTMAIMTGSSWCYHHTKICDIELYGTLKSVKLEKQAIEVRKKLAGKSATIGRALVLPRDLAEKYELILGDPQLVELKTDIAFIETRIQSVTARISIEKESRSIIKVIKQVLDNASKEINAGRLSPQSALQDIKIVANKRFNTGLLWEEVYQLTEQKRKLVETEAKRMKDLNAYLTPEQALGLVGAVAGLLKKYVPKALIGECQGELAGLLRLTKRNFSTPIEEIGEALMNYTEIADAIEMQMDEQDVYNVEDLINAEEKSQV